MRWKVLISSSHTQSRLDDYRELFEKNNIDFDVISRPQFVPEADLLAIVEPYDAIICSDDEITDAVLEKAKNLKVISKWGVGINSIDAESARRRGVTIYNSPGAFSESCALMVFSYLLHFSRNVSGLNQRIREGAWEHVSGRGLAGKAIGIIGMGNIGKAVAKRARAFDMHVYGYDVKTIDPDTVSSLELQMIDKDALLRQSDFVVLACDLNPDSFHLMSTEAFSLMKNTAILCNTARGPIVDEFMHYSHSRLLVLVSMFLRLSHCQLKVHCVK
jgi:D-3-phosphoglycerate dehydrogenase